MPEPTDLILLEPGDDGWTYRYEAYELGSVPPGRDLYGYTFCCNRPIAIPSGLKHVVRDVGRGMGFPGFPTIDDCCDRPFVLHGHKPVDLPPYSGEHATCRKCGSKAVETKFTTQAQQPYGIPCAGYPPEWLHRRCVVCGAEWDEACVRPKPNAPCALPLLDGDRSSYDPQKCAHPQGKWVHTADSVECGVCGTVVSERRDAERCSKCGEWVAVGYGGGPRDGLAANHSGGGRLYCPGSGLPPLASDATGEDGEAVTADG